jgi:class 3 adenylate cyclase/tetratricopeptide (TPR) repeat protein
VRCSACDTDNPAAARFCNGCGARLEAACPQCGQVNPPGSRSCNACGQGLAAPPPPTPAAPLPTPDECTPKHLAEKILNSRGALEGERKQVTVLFADLKGSLELLADRDPEEARRLLDPVLERMMAAVHRYEGIVNQVMGDGIMALFGAPLAHEDHAVRACYAALRMQEAVRDYAEAVRRNEGVPIQIRVGLNSGEVVVRSIGSDLHMDYTAVGQTTHLAARMEQLALPGTCLVAPDAVRLAEGYVAVKSLGPMQVKGLAQPLDVFELLGAGTARTRLQALAARGLTRFVGRQAELEALQKALALAAAGHGQVVAPVGEPGVGKSRLFYEFVHSHRMAGWLVLESGSVSYGKASSYLPVVDLLKTYCRIEPRDDPRTVREKLTGELLALDRALEPTLPALLALLDVPVDDPGWRALDPPQRRARTLDACKRLLLRESREQPLLLVFEDLHWVDAETQALLDSLVESLPTARILLLVNYRPEYRHGWANKSYYAQLRIDPLPAGSADELLGALLGEDPSVQPLRPLLIERTEGNPFFLEQSVRSLVETGVLAGERGAYRLAKSLPSIRVPATVQAVLAARIDRLSPDDKRLLQSGAVIGKDLPFSLLQAIADLPEAELRSGLARLQAAEFLYEASLFPELEYTFKHALTHEVAYGSLLQDRRRALHGRIVDAIEALYPDRLAEQVERLGHHALRGERWEAAVTYLRQAGAKAGSRSANREAAAYFEQALFAVDNLPDSRAKLEQAVDLRLDLRNTLQAFADPSQILERLREAEALVEALDDSRRMVMVAAYMSNCFWWLSDHRRAIQLGQRAVTVAEALGDPDLQVTADYYLAAPYADQGDHRRTVQSYRRVVAGLEGDLLRRWSGQSSYPSVVSRALLAWSLAELGEFAEGAALGEEAVRIAESVNHPHSLTLAHFYLGGLYLRQGRPPESIASLERGLRLCETWDLARPLPTVAAGLGAAHTLAGRVGEGLPLLEQGVDHAATGGTTIDSSLRAGWLSQAYLAAGRAENACLLARRAVELAVQRQERGYQAWALWYLGDSTVRRDPADADQAEAHYRQALALAEELGMRPLQAHCHLGLGKLHRRVGRVEQAQAELTRAIDLYRDMEMTFWLPEAEAALARV